jgi:uncharacterized membrane protein
VIGASMIALAALVYLPRPAIAIAAVAIIAGHNLLDGIRADDLGSARWVWYFLHQPGLVRLGNGTSIFVLYPLLPWIGVMAAGYALGPVMQLDPELLLEGRISPGRCHRPSLRRGGLVGLVPEADVARRCVPRSVVAVGVSAARRVEATPPWFHA